MTVNIGGGTGKCGAPAAVYLPPIPPEVASSRRYVLLIANAVRYGDEDNPQTSVQNAELEDMAKSVMFYRQPLIDPRDWTPETRSAAANRPSTTKRYRQKSSARSHTEERQSASRMRAAAARRRTRFHSEDQRDSASVNESAVWEASPPLGLDTLNFRQEKTGWREIWRLLQNLVRDGLLSPTRYASVQRPARAMR